MVDEVLDEQAHSSGLFAVGQHQGDFAFRQIPFREQALQAAFGLMGEAAKVARAATPRPARHNSDAMRMPLTVWAAWTSTLTVERPSLNCHSGLLGARTTQGSPASSSGQAFGHQAGVRHGSVSYFHVKGVGQQVDPAVGILTVKADARPAGGKGGRNAGQIILVNVGLAEKRTGPLGSPLTSINSFLTSSISTTIRFGFSKSKRPFPVNSIFLAPRRKREKPRFFSRAATRRERVESGMSRISAARLRLFCRPTSTKTGMSRKKSLIVSHLWKSRFHGNHLSNAEILLALRPISGGFD